VGVCGWAVGPGVRSVVGGGGWGGVCVGCGVGGGGGLGITLNPICDTGGGGAWVSHKGGWGPRAHLVLLQGGGWLRAG